MQLTGFPTPPVGCAVNTERVDEWKTWTRVRNREIKEEEEEGEEESAELTGRLKDGEIDGVHR